MTTFILNGQQVTATAPDDTPLLWVVRDEFKLKGAKFGCGATLCGACSMLIDGRSVRTCVLPLSAVAGKEIKTIEGLGTPEAPSPLQQAWVKHSVPQCGYCQSGQIVSATALLEKNPTPSDDEILAAMRGNICRCGAYSAIKAAIREVADANAESVHHFDPSNDAVEAS